MGRLLAAVAGLALGLVLAAPAAAADVPYAVTLGDLSRPIGEGTTVAYNRHGVIFMDLVRATRVFNGLLTFAKHSATLTIGKHTETYSLGSLDAVLDGSPVRLRGAPFIGPTGDYYVPISSVAYLGGAGLRVNRAKHVVNLQLGTQPPPPLPAPSTTSQEGSGDRLQPSPAQALSFTPTASYDAAGLHVKVDVVNVTAQAFTVTFPSSAEVAFIVSKDGNVVWDSTTGKRYLQTLTSITLPPHGRRSYADDWSGFGHAGAGRYTVRARLLTAQPTDSQSVSIGVLGPTPLPS